jgi:hypothetical protein
MKPHNVNETIRSGRSFQVAEVGFQELTMRRLLLVALLSLPVFGSGTCLAHDLPQPCTFFGDTEIKALELPASIGPRVQEDLSDGGTICLFKSLSGPEASQVELIAAISVSPADKGEFERRRQSLLREISGTKPGDSVGAAANQVHVSDTAFCTVLRLGDTESVSCLASRVGYLISISHMKTKASASSHLLPPEFEILGGAPVHP